MEGKLQEMVKSLSVGSKEEMKFLREIQELKKCRPKVTQVKTMEAAWWAPTLSRAARENIAAITSEVNSLRDGRRKIQEGRRSQTQAGPEGGGTAPECDSSRPSDVGQLPLGTAPLHSGSPAAPPRPAGGTPEQGLQVPQVTEGQPTIRSRLKDKSPCLRGPADIGRVGCRASPSRYEGPGRRGAVAEEANPARQVSRWGPSSGTGRLRLPPGSCGATGSQWRLSSSTAHLSLLPEAAARQVRNGGRQAARGA
jgi:hypothetical protein